MFRQRVRIPKVFQKGFKGKYVVATGDTMLALAQIFKVRPEALIHANPHITNPNEIFEGDVLCVPALIPLPCSIELKKQEAVPFGVFAEVFASFSPKGGQAISVLATLPVPEHYGNYDIYKVQVYFDELESFSNKLFLANEALQTYATRIDFLTSLNLTKEVRISIQPSNTRSGALGPVIFENYLYDCCKGTANNIEFKKDSFPIYLHGTNEAHDASGYAEIRRKPFKVTIIGMGLPKVESFGEKYKTYRAWAIDIETQSHFKIEMKKVFNNTWMGQVENLSFNDFDEIMVTAEAIHGGASPSGPVMLLGSSKL